MAAMRGPELVASAEVGPYARLHTIRLAQLAGFRVAQYAVLDLGDGLRRGHTRWSVNSIPICDPSGRPRSCSLPALLAFRRLKTAIAAMSPHVDVSTRATDDPLVLIAGGIGVAP